MKRPLYRIAAFLIGSLVAGCVYGSHRAVPAAGAPAPVAAIAVFPSAHQTAGDPDGDAADVTVPIPMASLHMTAHRYRTAAAPADVERFYSASLSRLGPVTVVHHGPQTNIQGFVWRRGPHDVTVAVDKRFVAIAPYGTGSEFAIVVIEARPH